MIEKTLNQLLDVLEGLTKAMKDMSRDDLELCAKLFASLNEGLDIFFNSAEWKQKTEKNKAESAKRTAAMANADFDGILDI